jgi:hypothetical protein
VTLFRVHDLRRPSSLSELRSDVADTLRSVHQRFANAIHAQTRVFTARAGLTPHELQWNDEGVPGETLLGTIGWSAPPELITAVEASLARGEPVRLFVFNSDADLCFEEALVPYFTSSS